MTPLIFLEIINLITSIYEISMTFVFHMILTSTTFIEKIIFKRITTLIFSDSYIVKTLIEQVQSFL